MRLGYCSLQVEVAESGGPTSISECSSPWCGRSCRILDPTGPARATVAESALVGSSDTCTPPLSHGAARICRGFHRAGTVPARLVGAVGCFLRYRWASYSAPPVRAREAGWQVDDQSVVLRWRRLLNRNTVIARRHGPQLTELSSSPWKARAGVAGFTMRFSSGRGASIRYMADSDALMLLHRVGRGGAAPNSSTGNRIGRPDPGPATRSIR